MRKYLYVFADCVITKGIKRSVLYDISRKKIFFLPNQYVELLSFCKEYDLDSIRSGLEQDDIPNFEYFINFIIENELGEFVSDLSVFPKMEEYWDSPSTVLRSIIDIGHDLHDFEKISGELAKLKCKHVQLRFYKNISIDLLREILKNFTTKMFSSIELFMQYSDAFSLEDAQDLISNFPKVTTILISNASRDHVEQYKDKAGNSYFHRIIYTKQQIKSHLACGIINMEGMYMPDLRDYSENVLHNSCLNRKVGIDENGFIKNCPSMKRDFGHISNVSLIDVVFKEDFQQAWSINKQKISICDVCEFRNICTDCRAFTQNDDLYGKPLKCSYDPYEAKWN